MEASNYTPGTGCKEALSSLHHCGGGIGTKGREVEMKGREKKGRDTHGKKIRTRRSGHPRVPDTARVDSAQITRDLLPTLTEHGQTPEGRGIEE
jgi:hypothetical protein